MTQATYYSAITINLPDAASETQSFELLHNMLVGAEFFERGEQYSIALDANGDGSINLPTPDGTGDASAQYLAKLSNGTRSVIGVYYDAGGLHLTTLLALAGTSHNVDSILTLLAAYELALGNPDTDGYILSSTTAGVRSWVANADGGVSDIAALAGAAFDSGELPVWDGANFVPSFFSTSGTKNLDVPLLTNIRAYLSELDTPVTLFQLHPNYIDIYKRLNVPASAGIHSFSSQALMLYGDTTVDLLANDTTQMRIDDNASAVYTPLQLWSDDEGGLDRIASHYGMLYYYNQGEPKIENMATLADDDSLYKASSGGVVPITVDALKTLLGLAALAYKAEVQAGDVDAEASTDGQILTSDGAGNAAWEDAAAAGASDMGDLTGTGFTTNYIPKWNGSSFVPVDTGKTYLTAYLNAQAHYIQRDTVFRITFDNTPALQIQALGGGSPVVATFDINATAGNFRLNVWENTAGALVRLKAGANGTGPGGTGRAVYVDNV